MGSLGGRSCTAGAPKGDEAPDHPFDRWSRAGGSASLQSGEPAKAGAVVPSDTDGIGARVLPVEGAKLRLEGRRAA